MKHRFFSLVQFVALALAAFAGNIYVSPAGDDAGAGSVVDPLRSLAAAIGKASPGSTIYLREGVYRPQVADIMKRGEKKVYDCVFDLCISGTPEDPITIAGYPGENVTFDLSDIKTGNRIIGFNITGDFWHLKDFDIIGIQVTQTGHTQSINVGIFGGNCCTVERVNMHDGMGIGVYAQQGSRNLILNCDAYNNYDPVSEGGHGGNCDGFGFHLKNPTDTGNVIRGCRAWRNSDDGFDLINNFAPVVIEDCWAWENGYDADLISRGDGTGIKAGGFGMRPKAVTPMEIPRNIIRNCIAWANKNQGFYANHHLGGLDFINNSAYANRRNFNMVCRKSKDEAVDVPGYGHRLSGNVAFAPGLVNADCVNVDCERCSITGNSFFSDITLSAGDFVSLDPSQLALPRKPDGSLPDITFLRIRPGSAASLTPKP